MAGPCFGCVAAVDGSPGRSSPDPGVVLDTCKRYMELLPPLGLQGTCPRALISAAQNKCPSLDPIQNLNEMFPFHSFSSFFLPASSPFSIKDPRKSRIFI